MINDLHAALRRNRRFAVNAVMPFATHLHKFAVVNADVIGEPDHLFGDFFMDLSQAQVVWQQEGKGEWLRRRCRQARVKETGSRRFRIVRLNLYLHKSRDRPIYWADIWVSTIYRYRPKWTILSASVSVDKPLFYSSRIQTTCAKKAQRTKLSCSNA